MLTGFYHESLSTLHPSYPLVHLHLWTTAAVDNFPALF